MTEEQQVTSPVRALREQVPKSQNELATEAGISRSFLCEVEAGKYVPKPRVIRKLASILHVDPNQLNSQIRAHVTDQRSRKPARVA